MTGAEFVTGVMEKLGCSSAADLAEAMGWKRGTERTVARWIAGTTRPSFAYVMEMVEKADLFSKSGEARNAPRAAPADPLGALEAKVDQIREQTADGLEHLEQLLAQLAAQLPQQDGLGEESG